MPPRPRAPLQIINPPHRGTSTFRQFPRLPAELRDMIWEQSLCHERLIDVELAPGREPEHLGLHRTLPYQRRLRASLQISDSFLVVLLGNRRSNTKLLRVSSESRRAALRFYRVQVPCYCEREGRAVERTLYLHPELDTLHITGLDFFPGFSHMLWKLDARRVGLVNIALSEGYLITSFDRLQKPSNWDDKHLVRRALKRLRSVIFGYHGHVGRSIPHNPLHPGTDLKPENQIHRSRPLLASISTFQRLPQDPRPIGQELSNVCMGIGDPRNQLHDWFELLKEWQIKYEDHLVDYRFMITSSKRRQVRNRREAFLSLQKEKKWWQRWQQKCVERGVPCGDDEQALPSAFGFWLVPIDAFGPLSERIPRVRHVTIPYGGPPPAVNPCKAWDISGSNPELCLQYLPDTPEYDIDTSEDS